MAASHQSAVTQDPVAGSSMGRGAPQGYALWEFTGQAWELKKDASIEGAMPSDPPTIAGSFVGQIRATPSVAVST